MHLQDMQVNTLIKVENTGIKQFKLVTVHAYAVRMTSKLSRLLISHLTRCHTCPVGNLQLIVHKSVPSHRANTVYCVDHILVLYTQALTPDAMTVMAGHQTSNSRIQSIR